MKTDGQLYTEHHAAPPPAGSVQKSRGTSLGRDEILILGLILLIVTDKTPSDIPLLIALIYILF